MGRKRASTNRADERPVRRGGRPKFVWKVRLTQTKIGEFTDAIYGDSLIHKAFELRQKLRKNNDALIAGPEQLISIVWAQDLAEGGRVVPSGLSIRLLRLAKKWRVSERTIWNYYSAFLRGELGFMPLSAQDIEDMGLAAEMLLFGVNEVHRNVSTALGQRLFGRFATLSSDDERSRFLTELAAMGDLFARTNVTGLRFLTSKVEDLADS